MERVYIGKGKEWKQNAQPQARPKLPIEGKDDFPSDLGFGFYDEGVYKKEDGDSILYGGKTFHLLCGYDVYDWLNSHHFDFRNLIEKGLALKAPKDMYKIDRL